jgi:uncharacterized membrane protein
MNQPMFKSLTRALFLMFSIVALSSIVVEAQDDVSFEHQIKPFLQKYCFECHQGEDAESFRMDNDEMMDYVLAGDPEGSDLYSYMMLGEDDDMLMPPIDYSPRPTGPEMMLVKSWILQGAKTVEDERDIASAPVAAPAPVSKFEQHIYNAVGSLHTAAVHLPIGLLLAAGLFGLLALRGSFVMSDCAYYCLWLGTWGAIFACVSGWWYSPMEHRGTVVEISDLFDQNHKVFWHRTGGLVVTIVAFLVCIIAKRTRDTDPDEGTLWKLGAIIVAAGMGWVGHEGGELTYGKDHYKDLNAIIEMVIDPDKAGQPAAVPDLGEASSVTEVDESPTNDF